MLSPRSRARLGVGAAFILFVSCVALVGMGAADGRKAPPARTGVRRPALELRDIDGEPFSLSGQRGSVVVLCFGSIQCPVSCEYNTRLSQLARKYAGDPRVRFVSVNSNVGVGEAGGREAREIAVQSCEAGVTPATARPGRRRGPPVRGREVPDFLRGRRVRGRSVPRARSTTRSTRPG